ncbi:MAG: sodium:solute symporter family protein [Lentisphaeria bacterium]|nr:sodium:solute symporter family protein [Lentisphaeria bacterium]
MDFILAAAEKTTPLASGLSSNSLKILWIGIIFYFVILLGIGVWSGKHIKDMKDFLVAGRRLPLWMATGTLIATWFGAGSSMGVCATVYSDGIRSVLADPFGASISLILAGIFIVGMLRKLKCLTVTDIIARRFGNAAGIYASIWMIPVYVGWLAAQFLGMGTILHVITGMAIWKGTLIGAVVILFYTFAGGMWAVSITDIVQVGLIVIGLLIIMPNAVSQAGGFETMLNALKPGDLSIGPGEVKNVNDMTYYIGSWIIMGLGCMVGQDLIQRSLSSKSAKVAISSSVISGFLYAALGFVPITIGFAARFVLAKHGITAESMGGNLDNQVMPRMAMIILGNIHPVLMTLFLAALISAIMSSADSSLLAGSSLLVRNVIGAVFPNKSDRVLLIETRAATVVISLVAVYFAFNANSIYSLMINCWASQLVVVFIPVLAAIYVRKASRSGIWATMIVSTTVWIIYTFITSCGAGDSFNEILNSDQFERSLTCGAVYGFIAGILTFAFTYIGERLTERVEESPRE